MLKALFLILTCLGLSACSSMVGYYLSGQESYDPALVTSEQELNNQGFSSHQYCSTERQICIGYLSAKALPQAKKLKSTIGVDEEAEQTEVSLLLKREDTPAFSQGTVILIHGFRISKEFMAATALYFRFLGYDVLMPDLLGHGDSGGAPGFGVKDVPVLNEWLDQVKPVSKPLFLLGNSMGAVTATALSQIRNDIQGLMLMAPMPVFDQAVVNYAGQSSLSYILPEESLRQGARRALDNAGVTLQQTDIKPGLSQLDLPVLLLVSEQDMVSPSRHFEDLSVSNLQRITSMKRGHRGMLLLDNEQHQQLLPWLRAHHPTQ